MTNEKAKYGVGILILVILITALLLWGKNKNEEVVEVPNNTIEEPVVENENFVTYTDSVSKTEFSYPESWGSIVERPGNSTCPEEDTYRTPESLSVFDREIGFSNLEEKKLPGSDSFMRLGIRFRNFTPNGKEDCNDLVLETLAKKEMTGEEFSSFRLIPADIEGFYGVHNEAASRLNTEGREQYTLFIKNADSSYVIIQPYVSFIPYFGSPELKELDEDFKGNMEAYLKQGTSAGPIRAILKDFREMAESLKIST